MADAAALPENLAQFAVGNAINNINGRNRIVPGALGGGAAIGQNNMINMRDRLFHAIYFRVAITYGELVPRKVQLAIEYLLLAKALLFFFTLVYVHTAFIKNPCTCLQEVHDWPRDGVVRVEIVPHLDEKRAIWMRLRADKQLVQSLKDTYYYGIGPQTDDNHRRLKRYEAMLRKLHMPIRPNFAYGNETRYYYFDAINALEAYDQPGTIPLKVGDDDDEQYIVEYSMEYGHLRLSSATRKRLNIPVLTVQLDPESNDCFGDDITRYLLKHLLGYDDLLMASVRIIAEKEDNKGYLRNVITGEHYRFVSMWWAAWSSYPAAFFVMVLFTFSVSMLLRYSHHQIFVFIVDLLQMLEYNVSARFPIAPLLTVILALVGMEAIMSEFFNDTTTAFYIILIVWIADQFDAICCHTAITRRHWLRFFFLYHFAFYAYHYRFSGQYRTLALLSSYLFIQHSMVFFFHRYELPAIMAQRRLIIITGNQQNAAGAGAADAGEGNAGNADDTTDEEPVPVIPGQPAAVHRARIIVMRLFRQLAAQRQGQVGHAVQAPHGAAEAMAAVAAEAEMLAAQPAHNATTALAIIATSLRRMPWLGAWLQRRQQFPTVRRVFLGVGPGGQMMHVRLQRINVADIPGLQARAAAAAAAATAAAQAAAAAATEAATAAAAAATAAATAAETAAERAAAAATEATTAAAAAVATEATTTTTEDVESNHGLERCEAPATTTATTATTTTNNINDAEAAEEMIATAEAAQETEQKQQGELNLDQGQAGVAKMLKNLNSAAADIINMPDTANKTATTTAAKTTTTEQQLQLPLAKQLANNLPAQRTQQQTPSSGEKEGSPVHAQSIMTDQLGATAATTTTKTSAIATSKQAQAKSALGSRPVAEHFLGTRASSMMDGKQAVDFIEGDSFTSTANYDADTEPSRMAWEPKRVQQKQKQQQHQQKAIQMGESVFEFEFVEGEEEQPQPKTWLMKTSPHTSNQVTTTAEAATGNN